jgi:multicomponent Na+:H+ antiporter subunit B
MSERGRRLLFLASALGLGGLLLWGLGGLPEVGEHRGSLGELLNRVAVPERHLTNVVTAVNFDYRGFDTLGEEYMLFAAVVGVVLLLRKKPGVEREEEQEPPTHPEGVEAPERPSDAVRWLGTCLITLTVLFGLYVVLHAHLTPGGGFQGGAILGTGSLLAYLATDYQAYRNVTPKALLDGAEAVGAGAYALVGLGTLIAGGAFLENLLPLGQTGELFSAGTVPLINFAVGLEVAGGFALLFREFLKETRPPQKREDQ